jgi:hypothetical protein
MDRRVGLVLAVLGVAFLVLAIPQAASAKGLEPFRVVTPSGEVGWVRGATAKAWWGGYADSARAERGCTCGSADATARYVQKLFTSGPPSDWGNKWVKPWLLVPTSGDSMLYYPPTDGAAGVVLTPADTGDSLRRWDDWEIATPRMQRILRRALQMGTASAYTGSSGFPTGWAVGGGLGALLLASLIVAAWRRPDASARLPNYLRHSRYRPSA